MKKILPLEEWQAGLAKKYISAGVIFFDKDGKILVAKPTYQEGWSLPGGGIDKDESPSEAAIREVEEELGLKVGDVVFIGLGYAKPAGIYIESLCVMFFGGILSDEQVSSIRLPEDELSEFRFVTVEEGSILFPGHFGEKFHLYVEAARNHTIVYDEA